MSFWKENIDKILALNDKNILNTKGTISNAQMEKIVEKLYGEFDTKRNIDDARQADYQDMEELKILENKIKNKKNS